MYRRITLTTDFSAESQTAFHHALALAVRFRSVFDILHVRSGDESSGPADFPHVRETLVRWGLLPGDAKACDVLPRLGVTVHKVDVPASNVVMAIADFAQHKGTDLLVAASHGRAGINLWLKGSTATDVALTARLPALLIGPKAKAFVSAESGRIDLKQVLFPVAQRPSPHGAFEELVQFLNGSTPDVRLLHIQDGPSRYDSGTYEGLPVTLRSGVPEDVIVGEAKGADLLLMATEGQHGLADALRGSTTARVLHHAPCPILAVPTRAPA